MSTTSAAHFYLSKTLPAVLLPTGAAIVLLGAALLTRRRGFVAAAAFLLWIGSTPAIGGWLLRIVEEGAVRTPIAGAPAVDAIVVLSGGRSTAPGTEAVSEWEDADRFFAGIELLQAGKAPLLVFTGGTVPGSHAAVEGDVLRSYATRLGVPEEKTVSVGRVVNTADEAAAVGEFFRSRRPSGTRVLLVTSAYHMPRARRLFERAGLDVVAFPVDFRGPARAAFGLLDLVPNARALLNTETALREMYGRIYYSLIGA